MILLRLKVGESDGTGKKLAPAHNEAGFLLYWIFYLAAFSVLEVLVLPQHPLICALDESIPFCAWFAVPYFSWFPALALSQGYYLFRDRAGFQNLCFLMFSGMTVALARLCHLSHFDRCQGSS